MPFSTSSSARAEAGAVSRSMLSGRYEASRAQSHSRDDPVGRLFVESWGSGVPVVLVHGSLATGADEWQAQRPLAEEGFRLLVPDRRGYGRSPTAPCEDFLVDAEDIAELMGAGAHPEIGRAYRLTPVTP